MLRDEHPMSACMSPSRPELDPGFELAIGYLPRVTMHRVYWSGQDPLASSIARSNRYDGPPRLAASRQFGVLYLGYDLSTCWMEAVVRINMVRRCGDGHPDSLGPDDQPMGMRGLGQEFTRAGTVLGRAAH